jgi:hypothetical protein
VSDFCELTVGNGERLGALLHCNGGDSEHAAQPFLRHLHWARRWRGAGRGLREGGRAGGVPLSTVTEPKRLTRPSAWTESSVPHPQSAATVQNGIWANKTIGVEADLAFRSSASQASCSAPNEPIPPALRLATLTSPTKCTPPLSNEYHPVPLAWVLLP